MIKANVDETCKIEIEGRGISILSELTVLADRILDKIADDDKAAKDKLVDVFCKGLKSIKVKEN